MTSRIRRLAVAAVASVGLLATTAPASVAAESHPVPTKPLKTITVHAPSGHTYVLKVWAIQHASKGKPTASSLAYGKAVQAYVAKYKTVGVSRYLVTTVVNGHTVIFAESATGFTGASDGPGGHPRAGGLAQLINAGKGNFHSLFTAGYHTPSGPQYVPNASTTLALTQDNGIDIVSAWYLKGTTSTKSPALRRMIQDLYLQWFA